MADVEWIKIYVDLFDNRKFKLLEIENPRESDLCISVFFKLLVMAARMNGFVCFSQDKPYTLQQLSNLINRTQKQVERATRLLKHFMLIEVDRKNFIKIHGWDKYQNSEAIGEINRIGRAAYMREYRKKKKGDQQSKDTEMDSDNSDVTSNITRNITRDITDAGRNNPYKSRTDKKENKRIKEDEVRRSIIKKKKSLDTIKNKISINDFNYLTNLLDKKKIEEFNGEFMKIMQEIEKED